MNPACILCGASPRKPFSRQELATWWKCPNCGLFFVAPQPEDATLSRLYRSRYYEPQSELSCDEDSKTRRYWAERADRLDRAADVERVLDVGCGRGEFLRAAMDRGWQPWGFEMDVQALRRLPEAIRTRCLVGDMERAPFEGRSFDAITLFDVIEHVRQPVEFLIRSRRYLRPSGTVMVTTPNAGVLKAKIKGRFWKYFEFERYLHLYHFTPRTMELAFGQAGFQVSRWFSRGMPMIVTAVASD